MPNIMEGVKKTLKKINQSSVRGPNTMPARTLRGMAEEISPVLTTLFQRTLDLGKLPERLEIS